MSDNIYQTSSDEPSQLDFIIQQERRAERKAQRTQRRTQSSPLAQSQPKAESLSPAATTLRASALQAKDKLAK